MTTVSPDREALRRARARLHGLFARVLLEEEGPSPRELLIGAEWALDRAHSQIRLVESEIDGMTVLLVDCRAGTTAEPHFHHGHAERLHVLSGRIELTAGDEHVPLSAGSSYEIPPGLVHALHAPLRSVLVVTFVPPLGRVAGPS